MAREIDQPNSVYRLSDERRTAVLAGMDDARRGDFASEEEIDELYRLQAKRD
jgi:predicted transcriptional regulator